MKSGSSIKPLILGVVWVSFGLVIGWVLGKKNGDKPGSVAQANQVSIQSAALPDSRNLKAPAQVALTPPASSAFARLQFHLAAGRRIDLEACIALIQVLPLEDCSKVFDLVSDSPYTAINSLAPIAARRWAKLDPDNALAAAFARINRHGPSLGRIAAAELVHSRGGKALDSLAGATGKKRMTLAQWILAPLAEENPQAAIQFLHDNPELKRNQTVIEAVGLAIALESTTLAFEFAATLSVEQDRKRLTERIWQNWMERDPAAAANMLANDSMDAREKSQLYRNLGRAWSRKDSHSALSWMESLPDVQSRNAAMGDFHLDQLTPDGMNRLVKLAEKQDDGTKANLARKYAALLAESSPQEALNWVNTLEDEKSREVARNQAMEVWIKDDPARAAQYIATLKGEPASSNLMQRLLSQWGRSDSAAALEWVRNLPAGKERDFAMAAAVREMRSEGQETAFAMLAEIQDPKTREAATVEIMENYAKTDGPSAAVLASTLSPEQQPRAFHQVIRGWGFKDGPAAGNWIKTLPPGEGRDAAIMAYVSVIDGDDPAMAVNWASSIQSSTERPEAMMNAFQRWAEKDAGEAEKWLADGPVDAAFKPFFQKELEERRKQARDRN